MRGQERGRENGRENGQSRRWAGLKLVPGGVATAAAIFALGVSALGLAACGTGGDGKTSTTGAATSTTAAQTTTAQGQGAGGDVALTEADDGRTVNVELGRKLTVTLESNPSTGYKWSVAKGTGGPLTQDGKGRFVPGAVQRPGAPGTEIFDFTTERAGKTRLVLEYRRPWEETVKPVRRFAVAVTVTEGSSE